MSSDAHAVRSFFQNTVPNALRRASSVSNKFAATAMGSPSGSRRSASPSRRHANDGYRRSTSSSGARSRSRSNSTPRSSSRSTSPSPWRAAESSVSMPGKPKSNTRPRAPPTERDGLPPALVRLSVNLRYSRREKPLLPYDIFVAAPARAVIADIYAMAAERDPDDGISSRYRLRRDKKVIVLCGGGLEDRYAAADDPVSSISQLNPLRVIFCVFDAPPQPPPPQGLLLNARVVGDAEDFLGDDLELDVTTEACTVADVWERAVRAEPEMARFKVRCLAAKRPADGVQIRIGLAERIVDVATTGAERYIFELEPADIEDGSSIDSKDKDELPLMDIHPENRGLDNQIELDEDEEFSNSTGSDYSDDDAATMVGQHPEEEEEMTFYDEQDDHEYRYRKPKKPKSILRQPSRRSKN